MSLILLESEKLISENVLDSSDIPSDFVNIFRKPIVLKPDDTFELVSMSFHKNANIVITSINNTMRWRIGNIQLYSNHDITITTGQYSPESLANEIKNKLNASVLINIYQFDCIYANQKITISFSQIDTPDLPNSSDGISLIRNGTVFVDVKVDEKELTDKSFLTNSELEVDGTVNSTIDNALELDYLISPNQPIFANNGGIFLSLNPQIHVNGVNVASAISANVTMTEGSTTQAWVAYSGSNGYEFTWNGKFYRFAASVPSINLRDGGADLKFFERGLTLIEADADSALPTSISVQNSSNFRLLTIVLTNTQVATGTTASDFKLNRTVLSITNQRGYASRTLSVLDLQTHLNFKRLGYKNGLVALSKNSEFATDNFESDFLKTNSDYQLLITQENLDFTTDKVKVKVHAYRTVSTSHSTPQEITLKIGDQSFSSGVDITTVLNKIVVNETSNKMDSIQLGLTLSKITSDIVFEIKCDENGSGIFTKDTKDIRLSADCGIAQKFKESMFPIHGLFGLGTGSYGQNLNPDIYQMQGIYSTLDDTVTSTSLVSSNVITADAVENTTVSTGELGDPVAKNYIFIMKPVPGENIVTSGAGNNTSLLNNDDVGPNNFNLGTPLSMNAFKKAITTTDGSITSIDTLKSGQYSSNLHVQLSDLPIDSFNGVTGNPESCLAIIPGEQIQTEDNTGKLYYQSGMPNKIGLNINNEKTINHLRVKLTNSTGKLADGLEHPTSLVVKLNRNN